MQSTFCGLAPALKDFKSLLRVLETSNENERQSSDARDLFLYIEAWSTNLRQFQVLSIDHRIN